MVSTARVMVCLSLWFSVCQVRGSHIPAKMNKTIQSLLLHYKISAKERFNGKPVFSREPLAAKIEEKRVFMGGILETYEQLIGQMLQQLPTQVPPPSSDKKASVSESTEDVRTELSYILKKVQELRKHRYHEQNKLLQGLRDLKKIEISDFLTQSKALWELPWLYEEASSLPHQAEMQRKRRRRRRQARRARNPSGNMQHK